MHEIVCRSSECMEAAKWMMPTLNAFLSTAKREDESESQNEDDALEQSEQ